jgi:hypothetical protein
LFDPASKTAVHDELLVDHTANCTNTAITSQRK